MASPSIRLLAFATLTIAAIAAAGCSRIYSSTTPFGEKEYRIDSTQAANRINGWPLLYHMGDSTSILWPLLQKSKDGFVVWPFYEYQKADRRSLLGLGILADWNIEDQYHRVGPFIFDRNDKYILAFPLFAIDWKNNIALGVMPLFYWEDGGKTRPDTFLSIPFSIGEDFMNIALLLYHQTQRDSETRRFFLGGLGFLAEDKRDDPHRTHHLLPLWQFKRTGAAADPTEKRLAIAILLYRSDWKKDGNQIHRSLLWPLFQQWRDNDGQADLLAPLVYRKRDADTSLLATPLFMTRRENDKRHLSIGWLLFNRVVAPGVHIIMTPLAGWGVTGKDAGFVNAGAVLFHRQWKGPKSLTFLTPLIGAWSHEADGGQWIFPLFYRSQDRDDKRFLSPPISFGTGAPGEWWFNVAGLLAHVNRTPRRTDISILPPFGNYTRSHTQRSIAFFPLFSDNRTSHTTPTPQRMYPSNRLHDWNILFVLGGNRRIVSKDPSDRASQKVEQSKLWLFPLFHRREIQNKETETNWLLGGLWRTKRTFGARPDNARPNGADEQVRHRLLYRVMDYERKGATVSLDMFPFLSYDRDPAHAYRRASFLGPLLRHTRQDDRTQWQIAGFKIGDQIALNSPSNTENP